MKKLFLDVGGAVCPRPELASNSEYVLMDIANIKSDYNFINGDICNCPEIESNKYDIVFCMNLFEHLNEPWKAAEEMIRITKSNGIIIVIAPFSWRYHPCPVDNFRFTHNGLKILFERTI